MESRVKSDRLIRDSEVPIELLELVTQSRETARHRSGVADVVVRAEKTIERCFHEPRLRGAWTFGRFCQSRSHLVGEINANSGFLGGVSLERNSRPSCV